MQNTWPYINGAYGVTTIFLVAAAWLTFARYRRALARLRQAETQ
ncbi:heme exporter protein CcmD [Acidocella sp. KAb 2-4]|nr:heme exporter protein CcmD [Acidocella sp. KAb 2-4]MCB5943256.1 heme exporter protein CcmD [Acidocella sp. KAb 2-4]